jgi:hypothetical protein
MAHDRPECIRLSLCRYHYGERVAFHFAFIFLYTKWLVVPAITGTCLYLCLRWLTQSLYYMRSLSIFGFVIVSVWGPLVLKLWQRQNEFLNDRWNVRLFREAEYPNPQFQPHGFQNIYDRHGQLLCREPYYQPIYRLPYIVQTLVLFFIFISTYILGVAFFVQWYTAAMLTPVCHECLLNCTAFLSCFHTVAPTVFTGRWLYIFIQV